MDPTEAPMLSAMLQARYSLVLARPSYERARAHTAYSLAGGLALALIAGGVAGPVPRLEPAIQWAAFIAMLGWFVTALLYIRVAGYSKEASRLEGETVSGKTLVEQSLSEARDEARAIREKLRPAVAASVASLSLTVAALGLAWLRGPALVAVDIALRESAWSTVGPSCNSAGMIRASVEAGATLDEPFVRLQNPKQCDRDVILVPTADIAAIIEL